MSISDKYKEHSCSCDKCKKMCKTPCLGTPEDMLRIAKAGFADKLSNTKWMVGIVNGTHRLPVRIIAPLWAEKGCVFQNEQGLCELHDLGLKPLEGRMTNAHTMNITDFDEAYTTPNYFVIGEWEKRDFNKMERRIFRNIK